MTRLPQPCAFTLIELLVVVTIIVVLLALLTPALDQAIYQAELVACGASLDAGATGFISYAAGNRRNYPNPTRTGNSPAIFTAGGGSDMRKLTRDYVASNSAYNDPLSEPVDYEDPNATGSYGYAARFVWPGYKFASGKAMQRIGDKWSWVDNVGHNPPVTYRFSVLISDIDFITTNNTQQWGSHPDSDGRLQQEVFQNEPPPEHTVLGLAGINNFVMSRWWVAGGPRGFQDLNFAMDDGSVERHVEVAWNDTILGAETGRLRGVPWNADESWPGQTLCTVPLAN
jgi:prepilin-type N-terminal cleavage/methylation domain-containing protein